MSLTKCYKFPLRSLPPTLEIFVSATDKTQSGVKRFANVALYKPQTIAEPIGSSGTGLLNLTHRRSLRCFSFSGRAAVTQTASNLPRRFLKERKLIDSWSLHFFFQFLCALYILQNCIKWGCLLEQLGSTYSGNSHSKINGEGLFGWSR